MSMIPTTCGVSNLEGAGAITCGGVAGLGSTFATTGPSETLVFAVVTLEGVDDAVFAEVFVGAEAPDAGAPAFGASTGIITGLGGLSWSQTFFLSSSIFKASSSSRCNASF